MKYIYIYILSEWLIEREDESRDGDWEGDLIEKLDG